MNETLIYTIAILVGLGLIAAVVLYFVAQKFKVYEDPRIDETEARLPGANCGGCGFPGCRGMAEALVKNDDISALYCPVGGAPTMKAVAEYLGKAVAEKEPQVAVVRCGGTLCNRARTNTFDGARSCAVEAALYGGETGCTFGCLGNGDCTRVCNFDAIHMNPETGLPEVDEEKCTACGACVKACPSGALSHELTDITEAKMGVAAIDHYTCLSWQGLRCEICYRDCPEQNKAIVIVSQPRQISNHAMFVPEIHPDKCTGCGLCVHSCPTDKPSINIVDRKSVV